MLSYKSTCVLPSFRPRSKSEILLRSTLQISSYLPPSEGLFFSLSFSPFPPFFFLGGGVKLQVPLCFPLLFFTSVSANPDALLKRNGFAKFHWAKNSFLKVFLRNRVGRNFYHPFYNFLTPQRQREGWSREDLLRACLFFYPSSFERNHDPTRSEQSSALDESLLSSSPVARCQMALELRRDPTLSAPPPPSSPSYFRQLILSS